MDQYLNEGRELARQGRMGAAVSAWLTGLEATSELAQEPLYWLELGGALRAAGQVEQALALHQYAQQLNPSEYQRAALDLHLAADLLALKQYDLADKALLRAQQFSNFQRCPYLLEIFSQLQGELGQLEAAEAALEQALVLYHDHPSALASCSLALLKLFARTPQVSAERLSAAIAIAEQYIEVLPFDGREMRVVLAHACQQLARNQDAIRFYRAAMAMPVQRSRRAAKPRRLNTIEYKLRQITSEIEIELLREKNAVQHLQVQQLESVGFRDEITGLYNVRYLEMRWPELFDTTRAADSFCLISLGIDFFSSLNEVLGKERTLVLYTQVAKVLQSAFPSDAILAAEGSEAFSLVVFEMNKAKIEAIFELVQQQVAKLEQSYLPEPLRLSAGGAFYVPGETSDVLQLRSNLALFLGQRQENGRICWDGDVA